jgi:small-conductance mechanosensitive channel
MIARVLKINVRTTKIESRDGNTLIIPNSMLTQNEVENWSFGSDLTRFHIDVGVAYGSNTELVKELLKQAAMSHPQVKKTKPILVRLMNFGDNALELQLSFWADQSWEVEVHKSEIRFEIDRLFRQHGVEIPFPQRTLHVPSPLKVGEADTPKNQKEEG